MAISKMCNVCLETKPIGHFGRCATSRDGLYGQCKECKYKKSRLWAKSEKGMAIIKKSRQKYWKTEKGKIARSKYNRSEAYGKVLERHLALPKTRYSRYKSNANHRGIEFSLTFEEFMVYWQKPCHYCGDLIETIGLDRIDNSIGYIEGNITPCCYWCNVSKSEQSFEEYVSRCFRVTKKHCKIYRCEKGGGNGSGFD